MPDLPDPPVADASPTPSALRTPATPDRGWRRRAGTVSLVHGTIRIPLTAGFWRKMLAFAGPGYLVAAGYMDPGNWATDLAGGSRYGYTLLSVLMLMSTPGHRFLQDLLRGSTADRVRHGVSIPVLMVRAK
jgi:Universal stress protein family